MSAYKTVSDIGNADRQTDFRFWDISHRGLLADIKGREVFILFLGISGFKGAVGICLEF